MKCQINRESIHRTSANIAFGIDDAAFISQTDSENGVVTSITMTSNENTLLLAKKLRALNIHCAVNNETNTVIIDDTEDTEQLIKAVDDIDMSLNSEVEVNHVPMKDEVYFPSVRELNDFRSVLVYKREKILDEIRKLNQKSFSLTSLDEKEQIMRQRALLQNVSDNMQNAVEMLKKIKSTSYDNIFGAVDSVLELLKLMVNNLRDDTAKVSDEQKKWLSEFISDVDTLFKTYFKSHDGSIMMNPTDETTKKVIEKYRAQQRDFDNIKSIYDTIYKKNILSYIRNNEQLNDVFGSDIMQQKTDIGRKMFEELFGGAILKDKGFFEYLGLNIDKTFSSTSALEQFLQMEVEDATLLNQTKAIQLNDRISSITKKLKDLGIDLTDYEQSSFLRQKDKNGNETGSYVGVFTKEFFNEVNFRKKYPYWTAAGKVNVVNLNKIGDEIIKKFDIMNFFRFSFILDEPIEKIVDILEAYRKFKGISPDMSYEAIKKDIVNKYWSDEHTVRKNKEKEKSLREKMGDIAFEAELQKRISNFLTSSIRYENAIRNEKKSADSKNQVLMFDAIEKMKETGRPQLRTSDVFYDFSDILFIPDMKSEYWDKSYYDNFVVKSEANNLKMELYKIILDIMPDIQSMYYNNYNAMFFPKISRTFIESLADSKNNSIRKILGDFIEENLYTNPFTRQSNENIATNYQDIQKKKMNMLISQFKDEQDFNKIIEKGREYGIEYKDYLDKNDFIWDLALKISMETSDFSKNMIKALTSIITLYYAQKARYEVDYKAQMIYDQYRTYKTESGSERTTANRQMYEYILRVIRRLDVDKGESLLNKRLGNVAFLKAITQNKTDHSFLKKIVVKLAQMKFDDEEKEAFEMYKELEKGYDKSMDYEFSRNGKIYKYVAKDTKGMKKGFYGKFKNDEMWNQIEEDVFENERMKYIAYRIEALGKSCTIGKICEAMQRMVIFKALAGVSTAGIFNRIEGRLANAEMDASGYYWTPGNLARANVLFFGSGLYRYLDNKGNPAFRADSKEYKRREIFNQIAIKTGIFEDMKNQLDKNIDISKTSIWGHNLDLYQFSISNPEFKNQLTAVCCVLMDIKVKDKNGKEYSMIENGEFTMFDLKDGKIVLKPEFDTEENRTWSEMKVFNEKKEDDLTIYERTDFARFVTYCKEMISTIHGDYRPNACVGYTNSEALKFVMSLKKWYGAKVYRGWNPGNGFNINVLHKGDKYRVKQAGKYYDLMVFGNGLMKALPVFMQTLKLDTGLLKGIPAVIGAVKLVKSRLQANDEQIAENISELSVQLEYLKSVAFETVFFIPRLFGKSKVFGKGTQDVGYMKNREDFIEYFGKRKMLSFGKSEKDFTSEEYSRLVEEYGKTVIGNFKSTAREVGAFVCLTAIGLMAKALFWSPDDGDEDERRLFYNWIDNNLNKILQSTNDTMFMLNSIEDKYSVDGLPILRWANDIGRYIQEVNKGGFLSDKSLKYGFRMLPLPRGLVFEDQFSMYHDFLSITSDKDDFSSWISALTPTMFKSSYEYKKGEWSDIIAKNISSGGEYVDEQQYKKLREKTLEHYIKQIKKQKLSVDDKSKLDAYLERNNYSVNNIYELKDEKQQKNAIRNALMPNKSHKEYKRYTTKGMLEVYKDYMKENHINKGIFKYYHKNPLIWDFINQDRMEYQEKEEASN